jgi:heat-inducible transcriptional repressor|tara:strand:- start:280 stop:1323 length:1044 start_codon:yes stop_codon:yes gene_type:complete
LTTAVSEKAQYLLKTLVEHYIEGGQPVGSKTLSDHSELPVSPATVRNIMADLEERGFVISPHTSAGRVPTAKGYRFFVDSLITVAPLAKFDLQNLSRNLDPDMSAHELVESASGILSEITHMAGLVTLPKRQQTQLRHVEFLSLNDNRVLVILVLDDHEVQNRVIYTKETYTDIQLKEAANFINHHFNGQALGRIRSQIVASMKNDQEDLNSLMVTTLEVAEKAFEDKDEDEADFVVAGQENLIGMAEEQAHNDIRDLFKAFSLKGDILHLLDRCLDSQGVQLFIGRESGYELLDECTVVTAPYQADGEQIGVLGVIGPTRMAYDRVIPIVDATARVLGAALDFSRR